nr:uncharacterized protein CI109_003494 [Kwoniella shandongensis]KAA5528205.1 hypothetical protein CI109_003494 [Kwoniella shandongensis]
MAIQPHPLPTHPESSPFLSDGYKDVISYLQKMAAGPMPTAWQDRWQWEMPTVHLVLLEMIERTYLYATWASEQNDLLNYLGYAEACFFQVYKHHGMEEEFLFPAFTEKTGEDLWLRNVEEHHTFDKALDATWLYVRHQRSLLTTIPSPVPEPTDEFKATIDLSEYPDLDFDKPFDAAAFRRHIDGFIMPLAKHLGAEIETLKPELMERIGKDGMIQINKGVEARLKAYGPAWFLCSAISEYHLRSYRASSGGLQYGALQTAHPTSLSGPKSPNPIRSGTKVQELLDVFRASRD